jgi:electron transport complex protein RnfC
LKKIIGPNRIIMVVPPNLTSQAEKTSAETQVIKPIYPNTLPKIIVKKILGRVVPAGKRCEETGVGFISSETIAALASAFANGQIPVHKILSVINKDNTPVNVKARIGTPVKDILDALHIETGHGDRLVLGGPMTGHAIYSEDTPISSDTDAIMVQDKDQIVSSSDSHCINCGDCVRACPARIPVNMLVRLLENGLFEEAAREYDLLSCIECGLCSYVCIAQIPLFHYIMLGKYQFAQTVSGEESNA